MVRASVLFVYGMYGVERIAVLGVFEDYSLDYSKTGENMSA